MTPLLILGPSSPEMDEVEAWVKTSGVRYTLTHASGVPRRRARVGDQVGGFYYPGDHWQYFAVTYVHIRVGCDVPCPNGVEVIDVEARVQVVRDVVAIVYSRCLYKEIGGV